MHRILGAGAVCCALLMSSAVPSRASSTAVPRICAGCNLAGSHLADTDFTNAVYIAANFAGADLERASFRGARLIAANFEGADLRRAAFDASECTACNFGNAKLDGATFSGARITAANFAGFAAAVENGQLRSLLAGCISCNFRASRLGGRDLSGLTLMAVDFTAADLRGTKFDGATLCWNNGIGTQRAVKCVTMKDARVDGASFVNVRLCDDPMEQRSCTTLDSATLQRYSGSSLAGAIFQ